MPIPTKHNNNKELMKRLVPAITVLAVEKLLAVPKVKAAVKDFDQKASKRKMRAFRSIEKAGRNATRNAIRNKGLLTASAAAFALGIGLLARAGQKR